MSPKGLILGTSAILSVAAIWGGTFTAMKLAFYVADPMPFLALRFLFAILPLLLIYLMRRERPNISNIGILIGLLVFISYALQVEGLKYISATKSAFITGLDVPLVPLLEFIIFKRKPEARAIVAIVMGITGLFMLTGASYKALAIGDLLTIGCAVVWALQVVIVDRAVKGMDPLDVTFSESFPTLLLAIVFSPLLGEYNIPLNETILWAALYTGVLATTLAFFLQAWAQRIIPPESAALGLMAEPIFAYLLSWVILGEVLTPLQVIGAILILISIPLAS